MGKRQGLGDGLWVWFGADVDEVNRLLDPARNQDTTLAEQGLALLLRSWTGGDGELEPAAVSLGS